MVVGGVRRIAQLRLLPLINNSDNNCQEATATDVNKSVCKLIIRAVANWF